MSLVPWALLIASGLAAPAAASPTASAEDVVRRLESRNREVRDLTARFTQTYRSGALGRTLVERGTLAIKRPGRMLWEYQDPERKTFVSDGSRFYFYIPADRQVIVREQAGERGVAVSLLSGESDILDEFDATLAEDTPSEASLTRLRLTPRRPDPDVRDVLLELDERLRIRALSIEDVQGNTSRFLFEAYRENVGLSDRLFRFEVPRGVEVIQG